MSSTISERTPDQKARISLRKPGKLMGLCRQLSFCINRARLQVPRDIDNHNALITAHKKKQFEELSALVVKGRLPPVFDD